MVEKTKIDYTAAGVNIDAGNEAVRRIKPVVQGTYTPAVLSELGGFGAFYDLAAIQREYRRPVLVQSIDGVGTKIAVARLMNKFDTVGQDLVSACCNDIVVSGARPLTLLDYIACDRLSPAVVAEIVSGLATACRAAGVALVGGETAEMPGTYRPGEYDLAGIVTGVAEHDRIITGAAIRPGDRLLGLASSGLHTNGYSLARKLLFESGGYTVDSRPAELEQTVGLTLLEPHLDYTVPILKLLAEDLPLHGMAHITGGGFIDNIPRVLPPDCAAEIATGRWPVPLIFGLLRRLGNLNDNDLYRTFNMGIGMALAVPPEAEEAVHTTLAHYGSVAYPIGRVTAGNRAVRLV